MKKVLLVQTSLKPRGGGNAVAVWIIEALKREFEVSVLTWEEVSVVEINRFFGTSLGESDFKVYYPNRFVQRLIEFDPDPHSLQKSAFLMRLCKKIKDEYDVIITANGETDLGRRGIQYIHYPWLQNFKSICQAYVNLAWHRRLWGIIRGGYRPWMAISCYSYERMKENFTIVNSHWTGREFKKLYGIETTTVYPPVHGVFPEVPWEQKENGFVCIGRISGEKRIEEIIEILSKVRASGEDVHLHIIGTRTHDLSYYKHVRRQVGENASWVFLNENLSREELLQLVSKHKYGIHAHENEHFGIAVAEMVKAGCIVFIPSDGGQTEIIGEDERLLYGTLEDAVKKILYVITNPNEQLSLCNYLNSRKGLFSAEIFMDKISRIVRQFSQETYSK